MIESEGIEPRRAGEPFVLPYDRRPTLDRSAGYRLGRGTASPPADRPRGRCRVPVPVDVLRGTDLTAQGSTDIVDTLTSVVPSLNANREPISDAATLIRPVNLRALPADHTLVLVNGKRRHRGAVVGEFVSGVNRGAQGVDIYPLFGFGLRQVEVLRDGAAAQYGSDAIAGVINYALIADPNIWRRPA